MLAMPDLSTLTSFTSLYISLDICLYAWPPVVPCNEFLSFVPSWMSCSDRVMIKPNDLFSKPFTVRDIEPMFPCDKIIFVVPSSFFIGKGFDYCRILAIMKLLNLGDNVII